MILDSDDHDMATWPLNTAYAYRYVNKDRSITKRFVQHAEKRGIKGLFITVDAPQLGRREKVPYPPSFPFPMDLQWVSGI